MEELNELRSLVNEYIFVNTSSKLQNFPLFHGADGFLLIVAYLLFWQLFIYMLGPILMRKSEAYNVRIISLIFNSFHLASSSTGIIFLFVATSGVKKLFHCNLNSDNEFAVDAILCLTYIYFIMKLLATTQQIFVVLAKRDDLVSFARQLYLMYVIFLTYLSIIWYHGQAYAFVGFVDLLGDCFLYTYRVIGSAGQQYRHLLNWSEIIWHVKTLQFISLIPYAIYHTFINCCCDISITLKMLLLFHAISGLAYNLNHYYQNYKKKSLGDEKKVK